MTASFRNRLSGTGTPSRGRRAQDPEEQFARRVTIGFIALIVVVVAIVVAAFVVDYWNQHFKAVASVGGTSITRDDWAQRARLDFARLDQEEKKLREAIAADTVDAAAAAVRFQAIEAAKQNVAASSLESLIDLHFQAQLAAEAGISVTDADVDAAIEKEQLTDEARQVTAVVVGPQDVPGRPAALRQVARTAVDQAYEAATAGTSLADLAAQWSTDASREKAGDLGFITETSEIDPLFREVVFALEPGELSPIVEGEDGVYRFGRVETIRPGSSDASLEDAIRTGVGWDAYREQVRLEVAADRLRASRVPTGEVEQANLEEIVLYGPTTGAPEEDAGSVNAAHILISPKDDPGAAQSLPAEDIAWSAALQEANKLAGSFRRVTDPAARATLFAEAARSESDDAGSGANGGDLGYFAREQMVPEFADPLFDTPDLVDGDIIGPVRSPYGYHVILFKDRIPSIADRLAALGAALDAPDAVFADVARDLSEGPEAGTGGAIGWKVADELEADAATAVFSLEPGARTEPLPLSEGYVVYRLVEKGDRPLDLLQRLAFEGSAFETWYAEQKTAAQVAGTISRDDAAFGTAPQVGG